MSDEPTERDVEALAVEVRLVDRTAADRAIALGVLTSDWYAERIAEARREGAAEALQAIAAEIKWDHDIPFGVNRNRSWPYRDGYYDGAHNAARVVDKAASTAALREDA